MHIQSRLIHSKLVSSAFLTILTIIMMSVPAANAQSTVGAITQVQGVANIERGASNLPAAVNMPVELHDKIATGPGGSATIGLVDGSSLQVGPSSTLSMDEGIAVNGVGAPSKVGLLGGSVHSTIVGAMRQNSPAFEVDTPNASAVVAGTEWTTAYSEDSRSGFADCRQFTDVDVQDGKVDVTICPHTGGASENVNAGGHKTVACCGAGALVDHDVEYIGLGVLVIGGLTTGILCATETWDWCSGSNENQGPVTSHR